MDWFAEKMLFPIGCIIFAVTVFAILIHFDLIYVVNRGALFGNFVRGSFLFETLLCVIKSFININLIIKRMNRKNVRKCIENKTIM